MKKLAIALTASSLVGCASYSHKHTAAGDDITRFTGFVTKATVTGLSSKVSSKQGTNVYTRTVGLESGAAAGDAEAIAAFANLIGQAAAAAAKAAAKP